MSSGYDNRAIRQVGARIQEVAPRGSSRAMPELVCPTPTCQQARATSTSISTTTRRCTRRSMRYASLGGWAVNAAPLDCRSNPQE